MSRYVVLYKLMRMTDNGPAYGGHIVETHQVVIQAGSDTEAKAKAALIDPTLRHAADGPPSPLNLDDLPDSRTTGWWGPTRQKRHDVPDGRS